MENSKLHKELNSFKNIWSGGYFTGYSEKRNQRGLEEYLSEYMVGNTLLEIGCGGGQWSKYIYELDIYEKIYCIDALSETHNKFWNYLGKSAKRIIQYEEVQDFSLNFIDDNSLDYVFSYDVFCHISYSGLESYLSALYKKCKAGSILLIMYADPVKYLKSEPENKYHVIRYLPKKKLIYKFSKKKLISDALLDFDGEPSEGRWYWIGIERFTKACQDAGFKILSTDLNIDNTNPITLFSK